MNKKPLLLEKDKETFLTTYRRIPLDIAYGKGVHLYTKSGEKYLDFFSGLGVHALGHSHPKIIKAINSQINNFSHISNYFLTPIQIEFTELLLKHSGMKRAFLTNSGTETVEAALKLLRKKFGPDKKIFSLSNSFHGRTYGALSLTANENYRNSFVPLLPGIYQMNFNSVEDLKKNIDKNTAAIFLEFVQGEGGINLVSQEFIDCLKDLRNKYDFAIVADEIQSGIGRTGKGFSFEHFDLKPDIIVSAKAIGGGLPLGALLVSDEYIEVFNQGDHGTTFGGNPVACAAGKVVLEEVFNKNIIKSVAKLGEFLINELNKLKELVPGKIKEIRGKGFMIGIEINVSGKDIEDKMLKQNILINLTNKNTIRLLPPLTTTKTEIDFFLEHFYKTIYN